MIKNYKIENFIKLLFLICLGTTIYWPTFKGDFVLDDIQYIVQNHYIRNFHDIPLIWHNFPMTRLVGIYTFAINYHINRLNPFGYHIFNFLIHIIATLLVWKITALLCEITKNGKDDNDYLLKETPYIVSILFLVHPCQTQAISYITQRFESMATVIYLGSFYCYLRARCSHPGNKTIFLSISILLAILGIFTKEVAITLPMMIIAAELIFWGDQHIKKLTPQRTAIILLGLLTLLVLFMKMVHANLSLLYHFGPSHSASHDGDILTSQTYLLTQPRVFLTFLRLLVLPIHQNVDYDFPMSLGLLTPPLTLIGIIVILSFIFVILKSYKNFPLIAFGLTWILVTFSINLAPRINVIMEHKLYLISFGYFLALLCFLRMIIKDKKLLIVLLTLIIFVLSWTTFQRNQIWKNDLTLWENTYSDSPNKQRVCANLGRALISYGRLNEAFVLLSKAIALDPSDFTSYSNRGLVLDLAGYPNWALMDFNRAISLNSHDGMSYLTRAQFYLSHHENDLAMKDLGISISLNPYIPESFLDRSFIYLQKGLLKPAYDDAKTTIMLDPDNIQAHKIINEIIPKQKPDI